VWVVWVDTVLVLVVAIRMFRAGALRQVVNETSGDDRAMMLLEMTSSARILALAWGFVIGSLNIPQGWIVS
jgi:hypothetical protein